jgi:hypothetical protein
VKYYTKDLFISTKKLTIHEFYTVLYLQYDICYNKKRPGSGTGSGPGSGTGFGTGSGTGLSHIDRYCTLG